MDVTKPTREFLSASRQEVDIELEAVEGTLPNDIYGHVFISYPIGSVNSNGYPFKENNEDGTYNHEYGSPLMDGDGMLMRVSFDETGKVKVRSRLLKTPCFHADTASKLGSAGEKFGFKNFGITRISMRLGARNLQNTANVPMRTAHNKNAFLLSCYDAGRPFAVDPASMELKTAIGKNKEWIAVTPAFINLPFAMLQSSAHPSYDPNTGELFTVNYTHSMSTMFGSQNLISHLKKNDSNLKERLEKGLETIEKIKDSKEKVKRLAAFYRELEDVSQERHWYSFVGKMWRAIMKFGMRILHPFLKYFMTTDSLYLLRWDGAAGKLGRWELRDQKNNPVIISQCVHQTCITKDYIILIDTSFKFTLELLIANPFPHDQDMDRRIRDLFSQAQSPFTEMYLIKRSDLNPKEKKIKVKKLVTPIPLEVLHAFADYSNPENKITLYCMHNTAACAAEWLRPYDISKITGQSIEKEMISMFALGDLDIGRVGKFVIDGEKASIADQKVYCEKGDMSKTDIGPNTWGIELCTYRDINDADEAPEKIEDLFIICYGLDPRMLSQYIFDLYKDYANRIIPVDELLELTKKGIPFTLLRVHTADMEGTDHYQFLKTEYMRSIQFLPRKKGENFSGIPPSVDGYIFLTMLIEFKRADGTKDYKNQVWIFDAASLHQGPVCKLENPELEFSFTLHSSWMKDLSAYDLSYNVNVEEDYNEMISAILNPIEKDEVKTFFEQNVYPHYKN